MTHTPHAGFRLRIAGALALALSLAPLHLQAQQAAAQLPTATQVLERYVQALGGREALMKHTVRTMETEMSMPAMGVSMTMKSVSAAPNRLLMTMDIPGVGTTTSGYDGTVAWSNSPMQGPMLLEGPELEKALRDASFHSQLQYDSLYQKVEASEWAEFGGRRCVKLVLTAPSGQQSWECFDAETGLMVAKGGKQESPAGVIEVTALLSDYKAFDGVQMPTKSTVSMMGQEIIATLKSVSHQPVAPATFELPTAIRTLVSARPKR